MAATLYDARLLPWKAGNEGKVNRWYLDPVGIPTIGQGFTMRSKVFRAWWAKHRPGQKFARGATMSDAEIYAVMDLLIAEEYGPPVWRHFDGARVTPHAMAAAMDMSFNAGPGSLKWSWASLLRAGKVREAASRFKVTATKAGGRQLAGLVRRRKEGALIMEKNIWPEWVKSGSAVTTAQAVRDVPAWRLDDDDLVQAAQWLQALGFWKPAGVHSAAMLRKSADFKKAVRAFQTAHSDLTADGILGRATRDQIQRVMDLRAKAAKGAAAPAATAGGAAAVPTDATDVSLIADIAFWGGLAALATVLGWLAWRYRSEIRLALRIK